MSRPTPRKLAPTNNHHSPGLGHVVMLGVKERLLLQGLLPQQSDVITLRVVRDLQDALIFSASEYEEYGLTQNGTQVQWTKDEQKLIPISSAAWGIIAAALKEHNSKKTLVMDHLSLYEKFVERVEPQETREDALESVTADA